MDYEKALDNLHQLTESAAQTTGELNEATTRFRLIDLLLTDVLGWSRESVEAERYDRGDYTDYELGADRKLLLVEAKREGKGFELPAGFSRPTIRLATLRGLSPQTGEAVDQAMGYCQKRGIAVGSVTNGHQIVVFLASRQDGIPPADGEALVFESLEAMTGRFDQLWNALSPSGLASRRVFGLLDADHMDPPPPKLSARLIDYPGYKNRNPVAAELQILGGMFLEDLTKAPEYQEEFVRETYCESGALSQYSLVSKEILTTRYSTYFEKTARVSAKPARTKKGVAPELESDLLAAAMSRRPILLVGDVGVGKSMFIKHLIHVDARDALKRAVVLYVDFVSRPALAENIGSYVASDFERQLRDDHQIDIRDDGFVRGVYHPELERFSQGIYGRLKESAPGDYRRKEIEYLAELQSDREQHLKQCLEHVVKGQRRQVVIFLDNVDQREGNFQEQVFVMGHAFAEAWPVTVFVALRPDTFWQSREKGSLSAYQPRVFTIDPPRVDRVIRKRLSYAIEKLEETGRLPSFPKSVTIQSDRLRQYIEMLAYSFEKNDELVEMLDNLSNGNLRKALDFIAVFVGSGHVDTRKIFDILSEQGSYLLPIHEFLRAIMYGDNEYYDPTDAQILNLFDIAERDSREHFLVPALLGFVDRAGRLSGSEGFVLVTEVFEHLQGRGFFVGQVQRGLERTLDKGLLSHPKTEHNKEATRVRITPAGAYSIKRLVELFSYVDAVVVDTPILDDAARTAIDDSKSISGRIDRARFFVQYLDHCWDSSLTDDFDWPSHQQRLVGSLDSIVKRLAM